MKRFLLLFAIVFCGIIYCSYADILQPYVIELEAPSENCLYGRYLIFMDTNRDGIFEIIIKTNCDGSSGGGPLVIVGSGTLPDGAGAEVLSGDIDGDDYVVRVYEILTDDTIGYLVKTSVSTTVTFYYDGYYNP